jgi:HPt (histidine-containing phosphotransfer) domain-containing protein
MNAYISKPIDSQMLLQTVETLAAERPLLSRPSSLPESKESRPQNRPRVFNLQEAVRRCLGNRGMFHAMVDSFFTEADDLVGQIQMAIDKADGCEIARLSHRLAGTVVYLGAQAATEAARYLEQLGRSGDLCDTAEAFDELVYELELLKEELAPHRRPASSKD